MLNRKFSTMMRGLFASSVLVTAFSAIPLTAFCADPALVRVSFSPSQPVQGDTVSAFIELVSPFSSADPVQEYLTASVNSAPSAALLHPSANLWIAQLGPYSQIAKNTFSVSTYLQDMNQAKSLQQQILSLDNEMSDIQEQIKTTVGDPNKLASLRAQLAADRTQRSQLVQALQGTSKIVGTDNFSFFVQANANSPSFPHISSISPSYGPVAGGNPIVITGTGFAAGASVYIGGVPASSVAVSGTTRITVITPPVITQGSYDVEVRVPSGASYANAILQGGYLALPPQAGMSPVAEISYSTAPLPMTQTATLSATNSYDSLGLPLSYAWTVVSVPPGSALGSTPVGTSSTFSLTPDVIGSYVVSLTVTSGNLTSAPVTAVIVSYDPATLVINPPPGASYNVSLQAAIGASQSTTFYIQNSSNLFSVILSTLNVIDVSTGQVSGEMNVSGAAVGLLMAPEQTVLVTVTFTPSNTAANVGVARPFMLQVKASTQDPDAASSSGTVTSYYGMTATTLQ